MPNADPVSFRSSPVMFVENVGQWDASALFQMRGGNAMLWLTADALWATVIERPAADVQNPRAGAAVGLRELPASEPRKGANVKLSFVGANPRPRLEPFDSLDTVVSYFTGSNPAAWRPDVPVWGGVRYVDLYPGIDLELTNEGRRPILRLAARPGADPAAIRLRVEGADAVTVEDGTQNLQTAGGAFALPLIRAVSLQTRAPNVRPAGAGAFEVVTPFVPVNPEGAPVIDRLQSPADKPYYRLYCTFLGGSEGALGYGIAVDGAGSAYVAGYTWSVDFPTTPGAFDASYNGGDDAFVAKLDPAGSGLAYATFLDGSGRDWGDSIAVDGAGSAYVTGDTDSVDFPTTPGAFDPCYNGGFNDSFVARLNPAGSGLAYTTYLGGDNDDFVRGIALDAAGSAYVTGSTGSLDFPSTPAAFDPSFNGGMYGDAFVAKLNPAGSGLAYATFLGGSGGTYGNGIAVDAAGSAYVTGTTLCPDFSTTPGAFDTSYNGGDDAFVAKLNPAGSGLAYATYLGGSKDDTGGNIAVDGAGSAYVTGYTWSVDFPTTPDAFDANCNGGSDDAFVAKLDPAGSGLAYATFLGGSNLDWGERIAVDGAGNAYVTGITDSIDLPTTPAAFDPSFNGGAYDSFVAKLNPAGSGLAYATYLGGNSYDFGWGIALDATGSAYVAGYTLSADFPTTTGAFDPTYNGDVEAFVAKFAVLTVNARVYTPLIFKTP